MSKSGEGQDVTFFYNTIFSLYCLAKDIMLKYPMFFFYNGQTKNDKRTNNDLENTTLKTTDKAT